MISLRSVAIHEAAHAVIARVLGIKCDGGATIVPNKQEGSAGHAFTSRFWAIQEQWDNAAKENTRRGLHAKWRDTRATFNACAIVSMAGAEAEMEFLGHCVEGGDGEDRLHIAEGAEEFCEYTTDDFWQRHEPRLRRQTRRLVRKHSDKIESVAAGLLKRKTLTGEEIDLLV